MFYFPLGPLPFHYGFRTVHPIPCHTLSLRLPPFCSTPPFRVFHPPQSFLKYIPSTPISSHFMSYNLILPSIPSHPTTRLPRPGARPPLRHGCLTPRTGHLLRNRRTRQHLPKGRETLSRTASVCRRRLRGGLGRGCLPRAADAKGQGSRADGAHCHQLWYDWALRVAGEQSILAS